MKTLPLAAALLILAACSDDTGGGGGSGGSGGGATSTSTTAGTTTASTTSTDATTSTSTGGGEGGAGGAGGGPDLDKDPADVTDPEECFYEGGGGANGFLCDALTITFSSPLDAASLDFTVTTSEGHTLTRDQPIPDGEIEPEASLTLDGELATGIVVRIDSPPPHYAPTSIEVELSSGDLVVGAATFEVIEYTCVAQSSDDWCWESSPLEVPVEGPTD